jgi:release factor glutamine methyltransferase
VTRARAGWTREEPAAGVAVVQPARGYRYTSEAFWLAGAALTVGATRLLDVGTGSGVIALLTAAAGVPSDGIDTHAAWGPLWGASVAGSRLRAPVSLRVEDVRVARSPVWDVVTGNPPYFQADHGPASPDPWRAAGRTEAPGVLRAFASAGWGALRPGGWLWLTLPGERVDEALAACVEERAAVVQIPVAARRVLLGQRRTGPARRGAPSGWDEGHSHVAAEDAGRWASAFYAACGAREAR